MTYFCTLKPVAKCLTKDSEYDAATISILIKYEVQIKNIWDSMFDSNIWFMDHYTMPFVFSWLLDR